MKRLLMILVILLVASGSALAIPVSISGSGGLEGLGAFTGSFDYTFSSDNSAQIVVSLTNTSPAANGGYLVAFGFNVPSGAGISSANLTTALSTFSLLGGPGFSDSVQASPFAPFDIGASSSADWLGGGSPTGGIGVGSSGQFTLSLTGSGFAALGPGDFFAAGDPWFAARFRGFLDGGSDKVPGVPGDPGGPAPVPEPATMLLLGAGLAGMAGFGKRRMAKR